MFKIMFADFMSPGNGSVVGGVAWESKTRPKKAVTLTIRSADSDKRDNEDDDDDGQKQRASTVNENIKVS